MNERMNAFRNKNNIRKLHPPFLLVFISLLYGVLDEALFITLDIFEAVVVAFTIYVLAWPDCMTPRISKIRK